MLGKLPNLGSNAGTKPCAYPKPWCCVFIGNCGLPDDTLGIDKLAHLSTSCYLQTGLRFQNLILSSALDAGITATSIGWCDPSSPRVLGQQLDDHVFCRPVERQQNLGVD